MATKDHSFQWLKGDNGHFSNQNDQYKSLNLNENRKCSALETVQSKSISISKFSSPQNRDNYGLVTVEKREEKKIAANTCTKASDQNFLQTKYRSSSWNQKSGDIASFGNSNKRKNINKTIKKGGSNDSTLSLHITAYENVVESLKPSKKKSPESKFEHAVSPAIWCFEIPRQMPSGDGNDPEIMQFHTSQRLRRTDENRPPQRQSAVAANEKTRECLNYGSSFTDKPEYFILSAEGAIHGLGIFAKQDLPAKFIGLEYGGSVISPFESDLRTLEGVVVPGESGSSYMFLNEKTGMVIDARNERNFICHYVNHAHRGRNNSEFYPNQNGVPFLRTIKAVKAGEEILAEYSFVFDSFTSPSICYCQSERCPGMMEIEEGRGLIFTQNNPTFKEDVKALMALGIGTVEFEVERERLMSALIYDEESIAAHELVSKLKRLPVSTAKAVIRSGKFSTIDELIERADVIIREVEAEILQSSVPPDDTNSDGAALPTNSPVHSPMLVTPPRSLTPSPVVPPPSSVPSVDSPHVSPPPSNAAPPSRSVTEVSAAEIANVFAETRSTSYGSGFIASDSVEVITGATRGISRTSRAPSALVTESSPGSYVVSGGTVQLKSDDDDSNDQDYVP